MARGGLSNKVRIQYGRGSTGSQVKNIVLKVNKSRAQSDAAKKQYSDQIAGACFPFLSYI